MVREGAWDPGRSDRNFLAGQGGAFGIAVGVSGDHPTRFAAVDDNTNDVSLYLRLTGN
jgi:hypothetical protein